MARAQRHARNMFTEDPNFCAPILASQFFTNHRRQWSGEQLLMAAVLYDVAVLLSKPSNSPTYHRLINEAKHWVMSDDVTIVHSFINICNELGLNVEKTRRGILRDRPALSKHLLHSRGNDNFRKINS